MSYGPANIPPSKLNPNQLPTDNPLRYMEAFQYIFRNPTWFVNILLISLCFLIPVVGPMVGLGYQFQVVETLHLRRGTNYPNFSFSNFGELLVRGVWPFLAALIIQFVVMPAMFVFYFSIIMCTGVMGAAQQNAGAGPPGFIGALGGFTFIMSVIAFSAIMFLVMTPLSLAAGLSGDLKQAFNFAYLQDFVTKMWKEMLLSALAMTLGGIVVAILGLLALCVGVYLVSGVMLLVQSHFLFQLYDCYLARGGMPIPLKPLEIKS